MFILSVVPLRIYNKCQMENSHLSDAEFIKKFMEEFKDSAVFYAITYKFKEYDLIQQEETDLNTLSTLKYLKNFALKVWESIEQKHKDEINIMSYATGNGFLEAFVGNLISRDYGKTVNIVFIEQTFSSPDEKKRFIFVNKTLESLKQYNVFKCIYTLNTNKGVCKIDSKYEDYKELYAFLLRLNMPRFLQKTVYTLITKGNSVPKYYDIDVVMAFNYQNFVYREYLPNSVTLLDMIRLLSVTSIIFKHDIPTFFVLFGREVEEIIPVSWKERINEIDGLPKDVKEQALNLSCDLGSIRSKISDVSYEYYRQLQIMSFK